MKTQNLISTMNKNKKEIEELINMNNITSSYIVINQITKDIEFTNTITSNGKVLSFQEKGISKSRNKAILNSDGEICIITDDDMYYENNYNEIIQGAYKKYNDADIIAFVVDNENKTKRKKILKEGRKLYIGALRLQSVQITFKRNSIISKNIFFDERFGTGTDLFWGEENIFLYDCLRKGLKIYYIPKKIATLYDGESSWNRENILEHFEIQGKIFYRMTPKYYKFLILQHAIRHYNMYKRELSIIDVIKSMNDGAHNLKERMKKTYNEKTQ